MGVQNALQFNESIFLSHEQDRWKFLEPIEAGQENPGFLLGSPLPVVSLTLAYIAFVKLIGPMWMKNREPFQLKTPIRQIGRAHV